MPYYIDIMREMVPTEVMKTMVKILTSRHLLPTSVVVVLMIKMQVLAKVGGKVSFQ